VCDGARLFEAMECWVRDLALVAIASIGSVENVVNDLEREADMIAEVREGFECGISLENFNDVKVSDQIEAYIVEKIAATEL
jgi:translation initiation factor IF-2